VSASVDKNAPGREREVSVARNLEVEREATVGNITGARGGADVVAGRPVDVASGARIRGTVGDITGIDASGKSGS
jgi:hypothetical protein